MKLIDASIQICFEVFLLYASNFCMKAWVKTFQLNGILTWLIIWLYVHICTYIKTWAMEFLS